jgi:hypothetical protein
MRYVLRCIVYAFLFHCGLELGRRCGVSSDVCGVILVAGLAWALPCRKNDPPLFRRDDPRIESIREKLHNVRMVFSCPVNLELFKVPKLLRCGHVVDVTALNNMERTRVPLLCPTCRAPIMRVRSEATRLAWKQALETLREIDSMLDE